MQSFKECLTFNLCMFDANFVNQTILVMSGIKLYYTENVFFLIQCRSLSILPTVSAYNNRAQAEINLKHWHDAMRDCQQVLELQPGNKKGVLFLFIYYYITLIL